ncbi:MAG: M3 family oligoendopeptidase [Verrucomicrobia bacterium]|nr:M3 family oligoendopeptidase [Verrucomicrobiota bacterium]
MPVPAPFRPRRFLPAQIDLTSTDALAPVFDQLTQRLAAAPHAEALEAWLEEYGEVGAAISEVFAQTYIAMTCQTDDAAREAAYLHLVENVEPWLKPRQFELQKALVAHPGFDALPSYYDVWRRSVRNHVALYREANVAREVEESKLCTQYNKLIGAMTVEFDGQEQTLAQMGRVLLENDRARRQQAWELVANRRLQDAEALEEIFDQLLRLREEIAREAGFANHRDYQFAAKERFDYTPEDCLRFHDAIEQACVPFLRELHRQRAAALGVDTLRPWDLSVDPHGFPPLKPFDGAADLVQKSQAIFAQLDPRLAASFALLSEHGLLDLESRKGKAPGGYQETLREARLPFIFMNAVGVHSDVTTLLHEAGHAFHSVAAREQKLGEYRDSPLEFAEVASMSMELIAAPQLEKFYTAEEADRARREHLEKIAAFFPWMAIVDAFQHWIYTHPGHTRAERRACWEGLMERFGGLESFAGYEAAKACLWHRQLHIFLLPFYYIEYGIAQLGALQMWGQARRDTGRAIDAYLHALALGGSRPLPELFEAAGLKFDFTAGTLVPLMAEVREAIGRAP